MVSASQPHFALTEGQKPPRRRLFARPWMLALTAAALILTGYLLYRTLSHYSYEEIVASVRSIPLRRLVLAGCFAAASYLCLTVFDVLALRSIGRKLPYPKVALASFISLSLGHSIGLAGLSSGAIRYRFYARWGLSASEVAKMVLFCGIMVGLGLIFLAGVALLGRPDLAEGVTGLQRPLILAIGVACLIITLAYMALPAFSRRTIGYGRWSLKIPPLPIAVAQVLVGAVNFALVAACLQQTLLAAEEVDYLAVAAVYVIANMMTILTHVPGGLGVIESVVMFLLPQANLIGAVLVFRFIYFLVPLGLGSIVFAIAELVFRRTDAKRKA
jgi:uncharacterized membrane protein YbhN (UPF0104 family)